MGAFLLDFRGETDIGHTPFFLFEVISRDIFHESFKSENRVNVAGRFL